MQLQLAGRLNQNSLRRLDLDALQLRCQRQVVRHSGRQPASQDFVVLRALFETQSALVRNLRGRLQQDQALLRRERVEPAGKKIMSQGNVVKLRILSAQREFESAFSILVAMTGARVAARLGEHGHHLVAEGDRGLNPASCVFARRFAQGAAAEQQHGNPQKWRFPAGTNAARSKDDSADKSHKTLADDPALTLPRRLVNVPV